MRKSVDIREVLRPIRSNKGLVVVAFMAVLITVLLLTWMADPVYEASAMLSISQEGNLNDQILNIPTFLYQKFLIKNQVAILESRSLASDVINRLSVSQAIDSLSLFGGIRGLEPQPAWKTRLRKKKETKTNPSQNDKVAAFQSMVEVIYGRDTDIIELRGRAAAPREAALVVNTWLQAYEDFQRSDTRGEVSQTRKFLEQKVAEMESKLARSEATLALYKKNRGVVALSSETEQLVQRLSEFETRYRQNTTDLEAVENQLAFLKEQLDDNKRALLENLNSLSTPELTKLRNERTDLLSRRVAFEAQLIGSGLDTHSNVQLKELDNRLQGLTDEIIKETKKQVASGMAGLNPLDRSESLLTQILQLETNQKSLQARQSSLKEVLRDYNEKLETIPDKNRELAGLERDVQVDNKLYIMLREKYEEAKIQEASHLNRIRVIDWAAAPKNPVFPKKELNLALGCFFGLLLGIGFAYGRDYLRDTILEEEDVLQLGMKVIGSVPKIKGERKYFWKSRRHINRAREIFPNLLTQQKGYSSVAEAYRVIRTSLYFAHNKKNIKTILITSAGPSEGKSTTSANLAITFAKKGVRTLLIDSDLRRPVLDMLLLGTQSKAGLTNFLGKKSPLEDTIRETTVQNLYLMPAGTIVKNASELLSSKWMEEFLYKVVKHFGVILLDSPPLLPVTDATILASMVDGVVVVAKANQTTRGALRRALDLLRSVDAPILGSVITGVDLSGRYGYKDYYRSYTEEIKERA